MMILGKNCNKKLIKNFNSLFFRRTTDIDAILGNDVSFDVIEIIGDETWTKTSFNNDEFFTINNI